MREEKNFYRNPSPEKEGHKAIAVIQNLSLGSLLPLLSVLLKQGPFSIYYFKTSSGGLRLGGANHAVKQSNTISKTVRAARRRTSSIRSQ